MRHRIHLFGTATAPAGTDGGGAKSWYTVATAMVLFGLLGVGFPSLADDSNNPGFDACVPGAKHAAVPDILTLAYDEARKKIIAAGWRPWITREPDGSMRDVVEYGGNEKVFWSRGYKEVEHCAPTGLTPCDFYFVDDLGNRLRVISQFEEIPERDAHAKVRYVGVLCPVRR